jgi:hypothetical protein
MASQHYVGGCQCGAVSYEVDDDLDNTVSRNCSRFAYGDMADGSPIAAINVNCLEGVDPRALSPAHVDGQSY